MLIKTEARKLYEYLKENSVHYRVENSHITGNVKGCCYFTHYDGKFTIHTTDEKLAYYLMYIKPELDFDFDVELGA